MNNPHEKETLLSRMCCFLVEHNSSTEAIEAHLNREGVVTIAFESTDIQGFLNTLLEQQKTQKVLTVTNSQDLTRLVLSLNATLSQNKLSVLCNGVFYLDDALTELRREQRMLHTADGTEYDPVKQLSEAMLATADGRILLKRKPIRTDETELMDYTGAHWGTLLAPRYQANGFCGTLHEMSSTLSLRSKAVLLKKLLDTDTQLFPNTEHIVLFRCAEMEPLPLPNAARMLTPAQMEYALFTNHAYHSTEDFVTEAAGWLRHTALPPCVLEDISMTAGCKLFPNAAHAEPDRTQIRNTLERLMMLTKEEAN